MAPKIPLTFEEASRRITENPDMSNIDPDVLDFLDMVERSGKEILKSKKGEIGKYVEDVSEFLTACVLAEILSDVEGMDMVDMDALFFLNRNMESAKLILGYAFMYAIGLASTEELR